MNYLITGGTGLIGQAIIQKLLSEASSITVLTREAKKAELLLDPQIKCIERLTIADIEYCDVIINLAGEPIADKRWSVKQKNNICHSRWKLTQQLVNLILQAKNPPSIFLSGSAVGMYGRQNNNPIDESYPYFNQEFTHHLCTRWEAIALQASSLKTRVALLRTGIVLSEKGGALGKMLLPFKLGLGGKISTGKQMMPWIHIDDLVSAVLHIKNNEQLSGPINLTAPNAVSNKKFSSELAKGLNRPAIISLPSWLLKLILGEMSALLLFGQNVVPEKLTKSGFTFKYSTIRKAFEAILK